MIKNICSESISRGGEVIPLIIPYESTKGTGICNPSILKVDGKIFLNIRRVGYCLYHSEFEQKFQSPYGCLVYLNPENDISLRTENFLCELNSETYEIKSYDKIDTTNLDKKPLWEFIGLEDGRLINWDKKLSLTGVRRDTTTNGEGRMEISVIKNNKEIKRSRIEPPKETYCEKNWMPILDKPYHYVKWTNPTEIVEVDKKTYIAKTIATIPQKIQTKRDLRGGSQIVKYKEHYICITHEVDLWFNDQNNKDSQYYHRFVVWDKDWNIVKVSSEFKFMNSGIEFACGLLVEKNSILITFGYQDNSAYLLKMPNSYVDEICFDVKSNENIKLNKKQSHLYDFINDTENDLTNYNLGLFYLKQKQYSSALSLFLRCAEISENNNLIYECLLLVAMCINKLGDRKNTEICLWHNALNFDKKRPEAYFYISKYYEEQGKYSLSKSYANLGLENKENSVKMSDKLDYYHYYQLLFQDATASFYLGQTTESKSKFIELCMNKYPINSFYKELIEKNIVYLSSLKNNITTYNKNMHDKLRYKFVGSEKIKQNYSQCFQDLFVLMMLNGKTKGNYLEIGCADPFYGNNTALLEELGWKGLSIDINLSEVEKFKKNRKNDVVCVDAINYDYSNLNKVIDYLQIDCDPASTTYEILTNLPFDSVDFKVITYEHDHYCQVNGKHRELSRIFLKSKGYSLIAKNIAPNDKDCYEDWYANTKYIDKNILTKMLDESENTKSAKSYILNN